MDAELSRMPLEGFLGEVVVTEGGYVDGVKTAVVFGTIEDACSERAEQLAVGRVLWRCLSLPQQFVAASNSAAIARTKYPIWRRPS